MGLGLMFAKGVFDISTNKANYKPAVSQAFDGQETQDGTNILVLVLTNELLKVLQMLAQIPLWLSMSATMLKNKNGLFYA